MAEFKDVAEDCETEDELGSQSRVRRRVNASACDSESVLPIAHEGSNSFA